MLEPQKIGRWMEIREKGCEGLVGGVGFGGWSCQDGFIRLQLGGGRGSL